MTAPTSPWNIPLFGVGDTIGPIASVFNSQSNALNTALNSLQATSFKQFDTLAHLNGTAGTVYGQHATVNADPNPWFNGDYFWTGTIWQWNSIYEVDLIGAAGWTAGSGPNKPRARLEGKEVALFGEYTWAGGGSYTTIATAPAQILPPTAGIRQIGVGNQTTSITLIQFNMQLNTANGVVGQGTGTSGSLPASGVVRLNGLSWWMD